MNINELAIEQLQQAVSRLKDGTAKIVALDVSSENSMRVSVSGQNNTWNITITTATALEKDELDRYHALQVRNERVNELLHQAEQILKSAQ